MDDSTAAQIGHLIERVGVAFGGAVFVDRLIELGWPALEPIPDSPWRALGAMIDRAPMHADAPGWSALAEQLLDAALPFLARDMPDGERGLLNRLAAGRRSDAALSREIARAIDLDRATDALPGLYRRWLAAFTWVPVRETARDDALVLALLTGFCGLSTWPALARSTATKIAPTAGAGRGPYAPLPAVGWQPAQRVPAFEVGRFDSQRSHAAALIPLTDPVMWSEARAARLMFGALWPDCAGDDDPCLAPGALHYDSAAAPQLANWTPDVRDWFGRVRGASALENGPGADSAFVPTAETAEAVIVNARDWVAQYRLVPGECEARVRESARPYTLAFRDFVRARVNRHYGAPERAFFFQSWVQRYVIALELALPRPSPRTDGARLETESWDHRDARGEIRLVIPWGEGCGGTAIVAGRTAADVLALVEDVVLGTLEQPNTALDHANPHLVALRSGALRVVPPVTITNDPRRV